MDHRPLIIGSRTSNMARQMATFVHDRLKQCHPALSLEVKFFNSQGDLNQGDLSKSGGKGAFVKDLETRLLVGEIDCAVHSLKDVPGDVAPHPELDISCFLEREDPRDALLMRPPLAVPEKGGGQGLTLATSSPRRQTFLRALYPHATVIPLRGNVDTRLKKLHAGEFDGMVLSLAGLQRLNLAPHVSHVYAPEEMLPAVGQGVLCLQVRAADVAKCDFLRTLHSSTSGANVMAERTMLRHLEGHCHAAIAGYCVTDGAERWLRGWVGDMSGTRPALRAEARQKVAEAPEVLGLNVAHDLIRQGAKDLIGTVCATGL